MCFIKQIRLALIMLIMLNFGVIHESLAESCPKPNFDVNSQYLNFACLSYAGQNYQLKLDLIAGRQPLTWKLQPNSLAPASCDANSDGCVVVGSDLKLTFNGLMLDSKPYSVILNFTSDPNDPEGLYWQYSKHFEEKPLAKTASITSAEYEDFGDFDSDYETDENGTDENGSTQPPTKPAQPTTVVNPNVAYKVYNVRVSYYDTYDNAMTKKQAIEDNIRYFADGVYEASNGAQRIGQVTIYTDAGHANNTDVLWVPKCHPNAHVAGRGSAGARVEHCDIFEDTNFLGSESERRVGGYTLLHEWGHFFYGLYDEYKDENTACDPNDKITPCANDAPVPYSAMHQSDYAVVDSNTYEPLAKINPTWLNFSVPKTDTKNTAQHRVYGKSGWETLVTDPSQDADSVGRAFYPELIPVAPKADAMPVILLTAAEASEKARSDLKIEWKQGSKASSAEDTNRRDDVVEVFMVRQLVVETSSNMTVEQLNSIKSAIQGIINAAEEDEMLGLIKFDSYAEVLVPPVQLNIPENREKLLQAVNKLTLGSPKPALGNALELAVSGFANVAEDAHWMTYLFASGDNVSGVAVEPVMRSYLDEGVLLMSFITNAKANESLRNLSLETSGGYWTIQQIDRLNKLIKEAEEQASPLVIPTIAMGYAEVSGQQSFNFYLDEHLEEVAVAVWYFAQADNAVKINLLDPAQNPIVQEDACTREELDAEEVAELELAQNEHYYDCLFTIDKEVVGNWQIQVNSEQPIEVEYYIDGFPKTNDGYTALLSTTDKLEQFAVGSKVVLQARVGRSLPLTELKVTAITERFYGEDGFETVELQFTDDGSGADNIAADGIYHAQIDNIAEGYYFISVRFDNTDGTAKYTNKSVSYKPGLDGKMPGLSLTPVESKFERAAYVQLVVE